MIDTLAVWAQSKQVVVTGIGHNVADAYAPFRTTVHGQRIDEHQPCRK